MSDSRIVTPESPLHPFTQAGATVTTKRRSQTSSTSVQGMEMSSNTTYTCERHWDLAKGTSVQATFTREGFTHKLKKLFSSEIQVGDPLFDKLVFVATDTTEATTAFLNKPGVQDAIFGFVSSGGSLSIDGAALTIEVVDTIDDQILPAEKDEAAVLAALLG